ncbi:DUF1800 domain-containing protein [Vineibacter terrae]|uniref:DUF1800 domain-containing protein n=1 Tax=Vineibacter terrae TaxID=2586908 RepID=UPI002E307F9B|nr:DUF1800 domain-containing protein [Vineibacter terrae]HEX2887061.1 DUF1800 domain-containing protein [Vineibacter terrae]
MGLDRGCDRMLERRALLGGAGRVLALAGVGVLAPSVLRPAAAAAMGADEARHLLSRTGFGPTPSDIAELQGVDYTAAVERVLGKWRPEPLTPPPGWINLTPPQQREQAERFREEREEKRKAQSGPDKPPPLANANPIQERARELRNWWVEEMLVTDQPFVERMTLFWHNHFTSSLQKVRFAPAIYRQNLLLRRHALGNFATLLHAVAKDPAMLLYLDGAQSKAGQPNENFARELLELFTLGEGHYTEADIKAAARAFTGWGIDRNTGGFRAYPALHDKGEKTFFGRSGAFGGDDILSMILDKPGVSEWIVGKLWRELVSLTPDPAEVKRLAAIFREARYEMKPLLRAMLLSPAFRDPANRGALIKSPVELVVGTIRLLGLPVPEKTRLVRALQAIGQVPFDPPNVKGWPGGEAWITTNTLLMRQQILRRFVEATTVAPMGDTMPMAPPRPGRRADRREAMGDEVMMAPERTPVEGRSLRAAGNAARLGPALAGLDAATLQQALLAVPPQMPLAAGLPAGEVVATLMLDPGYQLK